MLAVKLTTVKVVSLSPVCIMVKRHYLFLYVSAKAPHPFVSTQRVAQKSSFLVSLLINSKLPLLSDESLLTIVSSQARQQEPAVPFQCEHSDGGLMIRPYSVECVNLILIVNSCSTSWN